MLETAGRTDIHPSQKSNAAMLSPLQGNCWSGDDLVCVYDQQQQRIANKHLCLPKVKTNTLKPQIVIIFFKDYNKFDLPFPNKVNPIDIGIDITDVLRINDKVGTA